MAKLAVLASGSGTNFEAIVHNFQKSNHEVALLIVDKKNALAIERAKRLNIPWKFVSYNGKERKEAEQEIMDILNQHQIDLVALAGFMRIITPLFIDQWANKIINIHPSLLPKYPGTHGIEESYASGDSVLGISIHYVDYGMDTGPIIQQVSFQKQEGATLEEVESKIHALEHEHYPAVLKSLLDKT